MQRFTKLFGALSVISGLAYIGINSILTKNKQQSSAFSLKITPQQQKMLDKVQTGDSIFIMFNCLKFHTFTQLYKCAQIKIRKMGSQFESIGYFVKDGGNVDVIYNQLGTSVVKSYEQIISQQFITDYIVQYNEEGDQVQQRIKQFANQQKNKGEQTKQPVRDLINRIKYKNSNGKSIVIIDLLQLVDPEKEVFVRFGKK